MSDEEYQDPQTWDWEKADVRPGVKRGRVVVSVAFIRPDFERVAAHAEAVGKRTSEYIREVTLDSLTEQSHAPLLVQLRDLWQGSPTTTRRVVTIATKEPEAVTSPSLVPGLIPT